jgi:hypothetical protein
MVLDGGARAQEPLWKKALDLINKSDDDAQLKWRVAQGVSVGHPGYSPESLQRKWLTVQQQDYHPPRCAQMAAAGMPECASCPLRGKISSPLVLGRPSAAPVASGHVLQPPPASPADPPAVAMTGGGSTSPTGHGAGRRVPDRRQLQGAHHRRPHHRLAVDRRWLPNPDRAVRARRERRAQAVQPAHARLPPAVGGAHARHARRAVAGGADFRPRQGRSCRDRVRQPRFRRAQEVL